MHRVVRCAYWLLLLMQSPPQWHALHVSTIDQIRNCVCSELPNARGALRLRGGAGDGPRTRVEGGSRKGQWLGLKRSADGGHVIQEECASKRRKPSVEEEQALYAKETAEHAATLNAHRSRDDRYLWLSLYRFIINSKQNRSSGIEIRIADDLAKIKPTDPLILAKQAARRNLN